MLASSTTIYFFYNCNFSEVSADVIALFTEQNAFKIQNDN